MPNRIIKESICTSENLDSLSPLAESFFYRLTVNCDDYGRADARPSVLLAKCFPLKVGKLNNQEIVKLVGELHAAGLVILYKNGREYLQLRTWESHQQVRSKRSKYPGTGDAGSEIIDDIACYHPLADASKCHRYPIQSNPIRIQSESLSECASSGSGAPADAPAVLDHGSLYQKYPRKVGKTEALDRLKRLIRTPQDFDACEIAISRFKNYLAAQGTKPEYVPYMASFLGTEKKQSWKDWLDPGAGAAEDFSAGKTQGFIGMAEILAREAAEKAAG